MVAGWLLGGGWVVDGGLMPGFLKLPLVLRQVISMLPD